jgi:hypothetical protein
MPEYVRYLARYVTRFGLDAPAGEAWVGTKLQGKSRIQLATKVVRVEKDGNGGHNVTVLDSHGAASRSLEDADPSSLTGWETS